MKKLTMLSLFALVTMVCYGQKFTYKRVFYNPNFLKVKGEVTITDTTIDLVTEGIVSNFKVITISKGLYQGQNVQQFKMNASEDIDFRFSLSPNPNPTKDEDYLLIMETKDKFTNQNTRMMYYLTSMK